MTLRKLAPVLLTGLFLLPGLSSEAGAAPDLKVEIIAVEEGSPGTITVVVRNDGDSTARPAKVGVIITAGTTSIRVASPTRKLPEGKSATIAIPALLVPGLQLQAIVDPEQKIEESDEGNNVSAVWQVERSGRELVLVPVAPSEAEAQPEEPQPAEETADAEETEAEQPATEPEAVEPQVIEPEVVEPEVVEEVRPPPLRQPDLALKVNEVTAGEVGRVVVEVANRGITGAPRSRIALFLYANGERSEVEAVVPKLGPEARAKVEIPAVLWGGTSFQVMVDPTNELAEADESNNRTPVQTVQGESAPPQTVTTVPDLATQILRVDPGPPLVVHARVSNEGSLTSPATVVTLTLASGATLSEDVPPLRPGQLIDVTFEAGEATELVVMVDPALAIAESDEANNRSDAAQPPAPVQAQPQPAETTPVPVIVPGDSWLVGGIPAVIAPEILGEKRSVPGFRAGAPARPTAALVLATGERIAFLEKQMLFTGTEAAAIALAERYHGEIVRRIDRPAATGRPPSWSIAIDPLAAGALPERGASEERPILVSSLAALSLLTIVLQEVEQGTTVSLDLLVTPADVFSGKTIEANGENSSEWSYLKKGGPLDVNVVGAWQLLAMAERPPNGIKVAIIDTGFGIVPDLPPVAGTTSYQEGELAEDEEFHGASVASAVGAVADNAMGAAGPAGQYVNLLLLEFVYSQGDAIAALFVASTQGALIINMSFTDYTPRDTGFLETAWNDALDQYEADTRYLFESGLLLFASAGNEGLNVDELNSDGDESSWADPCENQGVICVGGWQETGTRHYSSNYGEGRGETVDIYGPYEMRVGPDPLNPAPETLFWAQGTSFASPFVAAVGALVWAANPGLSNVQVWELLRGNVTVGKDGIPMVNAYRPVRQALLMQGGNYPPHIQVTSPSSGFAKANQYEPLVLAAEAIDIEDGESCCAIAWESDLDGPLGSGPTLNLSFAGRPAGTRHVTVTATDSAGLSSQAFLTVDFGNSAPQIELVQPANSATLYAGFDYAFRAELYDDTVAIALPLTDCTGVTWTSGNPYDPKPLATGCAPAISFANAGTRTVTVGYSDAYGASASDYTSVTVFEPGGPGSAPLAIAISSPTQNSTFNVEMRIPLAYQLKDPGAGSTMPKYEVVWRLGRNPADMRTFAPLKDAQGSYIRIQDVFPERKYDGSSQGYTLHLVVSDPARPGSESGTSVQIGFLPALK